MNYCYNRDVATGNYDCPYAGVVNNSITCSSKECGYSSYTFKCKSASLYGKAVTSIYEKSLNDEDDVDYPF